MGQVAEWVWAAGARAAAAAAAAAAGPALQQEVRDAVAGGRAGRGAARPGRSRWAQDGRLLPAAAGERGQPPSPAPIPARRRPAHSIQIECSVGQLRSKMAPAFLPPANTEARFKRDRSSLPRPPRCATHCSPKPPRRARLSGPARRNGTRICSGPSSSPGARSCCGRGW